MPSLTNSLLSLKFFIAAMLTLGICFWFDLTYPYWAMMCVYIVAQPFSGGMRLKSVHMIIGSFAGGALGVLSSVAASTSQKGELVLLGLCVMLGLLVALRHRRADYYMYLLAGITALLVATPGATTPDGTFSRTVTRILDVLVGASVIVVVDALFFPKSTLPTTVKTLNGWLAELGQVTANVLRGQSLAGEEQIKLIGQTVKMTSFGDNLSMDGTGHGVPLSRLLTAVSTRGLRSLPLLSAIDDLDRQAELDRVADRQRELREQLAAWITNPEPDPAAEAALRRSLRQGIGAPPASWQALLERDYRRQLRGIFAAWAYLKRDVPKIAQVRPRSVSLPHGARPTPVVLPQIDMGYALRGVLSVGVHFALFCVVWAVMGWTRSMVFGLLLSTIFCAVSSLADNPLWVLKLITKLTAFSLAIIFCYVTLVLPNIGSFQALMLCLFPPLFLLGVKVLDQGGVMFAILPMAMLQIGPAGPGVTVSKLLNFVIALYIGMAIAAVSKILVQNLSMQQILKRLEWQNLADLNDMIRSRTYDMRPYGWRALDRVMIVQLRLPLMKSMDNQQKYQFQMRMLRELRAGIGLGALRRWEMQSASRRAQLAALWQQLRESVGRHLDGGAPGEALRRSLDSALHDLLPQAAEPGNQAALRALSELRVALCRDSWGEGEGVATA